MERLCKYFILALFLAQCLMPSAAKITMNISNDQSALLAFKSQITSDPSQTLSKNWTLTSSICNWIGVTCSSRHNRVTALDISNMNLTGTISPHLGNLSFLVYLNLSSNHFHGNFPHDLYHLHRLKVLDFDFNNLDSELPTWLGSFTELQYLSLRNNSFSGLIPPSISNMSMLEHLVLSSNSLQGRIPIEIDYLVNLKELNIEFNQLSGSLPFEIFNISSLESLALVGNNLSGSLPVTMCDRPQKLRWLTLSVNNLHGPIPSNISKCSNLQVISLSVNKFTGVIPMEIGNLKQLQLLYIGRNYFTGVIPKEIANLTMLREFSVPSSGLTGVIPRELGNLDKLQKLVLVNNTIRGSIPAGIFNMSTLTTLSVGHNFLEGNLPTSIGDRLPVLQFLHLGTNNLSGVIPDSITNLSQLIVLELYGNKFSGFIPGSLGNLQLLERILLSFNLLKSDSSNGELGFLTSLTNCRNLRALGFNSNPLLNGKIPDSIGNLSTNIERIYGYKSNIQGRIPESIGNLSNLLLLSLYGNQLTGPIPTSLGRMQGLQGLYLYQNKLSGAIPKSMCGLQTLYSVYCDSNRISGPIPECLGNVTSLRYLYLEVNRLNSNIPQNLWNLKDLIELNLSLNSLTGSLPPEVANLEVATTLDLSMNQFSGDIPSAIGRLRNLNYLSLAQNQFQGPIPEIIGKMVSLQTLDLSHNNLSGLIPISLEMLRSLSYFNVSFNYLRGKIPTGGPFENFTSESFISNEALCGPSSFHVPPCPRMSSHKSRTIRIIIILVVIIGIVGALAVGLVYLRYRGKKKDTASTGDHLASLGTYERVSYYELLAATDGYNEGNLLGTGGYGSVYRGTLKDGRIVAIKVFHVQRERALKSFDTECEVLRNLRHRNLAKVISSCSNNDFKALVLEFMPNGSLEKWLYSPNYFLDMKQRLNIMIDVASALHYLHNGYSTPVVHCDLKPSNILLDQEMIAHVSDFGIAKLLNQEDSITRTATIATIGYVAPEYGLEGLVSTKCDVYSYGIMLMEVFTRTRPNDERLNDNLSLKDLVNNSMPKAIYQVVDDNLLQEGEEHFAEKLECISCIMGIALNCSRESSRERSNMEIVVIELKNVRSKLLSIDRMP